MTDDDESLNLHWHALNFRTASIDHAQHAWVELAACVERIVLAKQQANRGLQRYTHSVDHGEVWSEPDSAGDWVLYADVDEATP